MKNLFLLAHCSAQKESCDTYIYNSQKNMTLCDGSVLSPLNNSSIRSLWRAESHSQTNVDSLCFMLRFKAHLDSAVLAGRRRATSTIVLVTELSFCMLVVCLTGVTFLLVILAGGLTNTVPLDGAQSPATSLTCQKRKCYFRELQCDKCSSIYYLLTLISVAIVMYTERFYLAGVDGWSYMIVRLQPPCPTCKLLM